MQDGGICELRYLALASGDWVAVTCLPYSSIRQALIDFTINVSRFFQESSGHADVGPKFVHCHIE